MKKLILSLGAIIALTFNAKAQDQTLLWSVESPEGKVSYLYGTYHLLGADFLQERPSVLEAFENSNKVVVETIIDSAKLPELAPLSIMPGGSLKAMVDSADYTLLKSKLEPIMGMDLAMLDMLKPMVLSTSYAVATAKELTPDSLLYGGLPLDMYFARQGEKAGKEIKTLETLKEQMTMLMTGQSVEEQMDDLMEMIKTDLSEEMTMGIILAYHANDLAAMYDAAMNSDLEGGNMELLIDKRNLNWVPLLEQDLQTGGVFIAVGALHLPGEMGLISLLQAKGYKLTALN